MAKPPDSTKTSCQQKLAGRARERWPQLAGIDVRWHGQFAYIAGRLPDGSTLPLMRLQYTGSAAHWGFAIYRASHDDYEKSVLPTGYPFGTPQEALDCACGLYLNDPATWLNPPPPTNLRAHPLVAGRPVDEFADQVRMAVLPAVLVDHVRVQPPQVHGVRLVAGETDKDQRRSLAAICLTRPSRESIEPATGRAASCAAVSPAHLCSNVAR